VNRKTQKQEQYIEILEKSQQLKFRMPTDENISIKCERGFKPFSHYFFTESEVQ